MFRTSHRSSAGKFWLGSESSNNVPGTVSTKRLVAISECQPLAIATFDEQRDRTGCVHRTTCSSPRTMPLATPCLRVCGVSCLIQQKRYEEPNNKQQERYVQPKRKQQERCKESGLKQQRRSNDDEVQPLRALPQFLWEMILLRSTDKKERQALRLTCKLFRQTIEGSMTCLKLNAFRCKGDQCLDNLSVRMQHMHCLRTVILVNVEDIALKHLPGRVATVKLLGNCINAISIDIQELGRLPCLASLYVEGVDCKVMGMESLSGLTRLHIDCPTGSLARLGPTLKHLSIHDYNHVQHIEQLTNLEVLDVYQNLPANFFQKHGHIPLKHLSIRPKWCTSFLANAHAWKPAPLALSSLTLRVGYPGMFPTVLPASITHLQLLFPSDADIKEAAKALPHLRRLDLYLHGFSYTWTWKLDSGCLNEYTNLQHLGLHVNAEFEKLYRARVMLPKLPDVARAVERGAKLSVMVSAEELSDVWSVPVLEESAWWKHT